MHKRCWKSRSTDQFGHRQKVHSCRLGRSVWESAYDPDHRPPTAEHVIQHTDCTFSAMLYATHRPPTAEHVMLVQCFVNTTDAFLIGLPSPTRVNWRRSSQWETAWQKLSSCTTQQKKQNATCFVFSLNFILLIIWLPLQWTENSANSYFIQSYKQHNNAQNALTLHYGALQMCYYYYYYYCTYAYRHACTHTQIRFNGHNSVATTCIGTKFDKDTKTYVQKNEMKTVFTFRFDLTKSKTAAAAILKFSLLAFSH